MKRECERCGEIFTARHNFRYCCHCEMKVQELSELWTDTIDDLMGELRVAMRDMFDTLDEEMSSYKFIHTLTILQSAFQRIPRYDFYDRQLKDIYSEVVEPTNQERADRDQELMDNHYEMKAMEVSGK